MVQYNQYVDPETDKIIDKIRKKKQKELNQRYYSKTDVVLTILQEEAKKYL